LDERLPKFVFPTFEFPTLAFITLPAWLGMEVMLVLFVFALVGIAALVFAIGTVFGIGFWSAVLGGGLIGLVANFFVDGVLANFTPLAIAPPVLVEVFFFTLFLPDFKFTIPTTS